jgi:hypothetical protein
MLQRSFHQSCSSGFRGEGDIFVCAWLLPVDAEFSASLFCDPLASSTNTVVAKFGTSITASEDTAEPKRLATSFVASVIEEPHITTVVRSDWIDT